MNLKTNLTMIVILSFATMSLQAQESTEASKEEVPFVVEHYYKIKWGYQDEFLELYKKNHWPLFMDAIETGDILNVSAATPFHHASEDKRWDLRVTVVWRNALIAHDTSFDLEPILNRLFPDRETFEKEEKQRFKLIEEHLDVPIIQYEVSKWYLIP